MGGGPISCWLLLKELARIGVEIRAVASVSPDVKGEFEAMSLEHPEIPRIPYHTPAIYVDASTTRPEAVHADEEHQIAAQVERLLLEEPADLILAGREVEGRAVAAVAARHRIPWVLRCGGFTLHLMSKGMVQRSLHDSIARALPHADATILQAEYLRETAQQMGCRRITVIPSPVDLSAFFPRPRPLPLCEKWSIAPGARIVAHASNMKEVKRINDIIDSAARILPSNPDVIYVIAGDGQCRATAEQRSRDLGLSRNFRFTGKLRNEAIPDLFALADIVIMASDFEQQSRVYLETQASGRLLIASDIPGARSVVEDGITGLLYPCRDVSALTSATLRALQDPDLRQFIGARSRARVQAHSLDVIGSRVAALLEEVVHSYRLARA